MFKDIKNDIPMSQMRKYKNRNLHKYSAKMPERLNTLYIFEERIVQGYFLSLAQFYKVLLLYSVHILLKIYIVELICCRRGTADLQGARTSGK